MQATEEHQFSSLKTLLDSLPPSRDLAAIGDSDLQARAVLAYLIEKCSLLQTFPPPASIGVMECPNCSAENLSTRSPYCKEFCREQAGFVRQLRKGIHDGTCGDSFRQGSMGQVLWHLVGGGYPRRQTLVDVKAKARLFAKSEGVCTICGAPATTFDHKGSACNRTTNLSALCDTCTQTHQFEESGFLDHPQVSDWIEEIAVRVASPLPLRECDDAESWDWRQFVKLRKAALIDR